MAKQYKELEKFLGSVRFRKQLFGGVDEDDVWRVFERLHNEYDELLTLQRQHLEGAISGWKDYALQLQDMLRENADEMKRLCEDLDSVSIPPQQQNPPSKRQNQKSAQQQEQAIKQLQEPALEKPDMEPYTVRKPPSACSANRLVEIYGVEALGR